ncbi:MAG: adenylosuccinate synthetase [Bdellovibrionota bacterium]
MRHPLIIGLQYGDEGKGKITDFLAQQADWVIRFNGGSNAGHTLWVDGKKVVTHLVPSGILFPKCKNYIGSGCVLGPIAFKKELAEMKDKGLDAGPERVRVDYRTHLTFPFHVALDEARELGKGSLGTTKKGIGPTYSFKVDRRNIRMGDFFIDEKNCRLMLKENLDYANVLIRSLGGKESTLAENEAVFELIKEHKDYVAFEDAPFYKIAKEKKCLLEGAQALGLDIDHGTYPFVTSSNAMPAMASVGAPFPLSGLGRVFGVFKAYMTRVGAGPFATELNDETGERIRKNGAEFGSTTGRPRRVGWLDLDDLKKYVELSDVTDLVITKSDILSGEEKVILKRKNELVECEGWTDTLDGEKLAPNLDKYLSLIEEFVGVNITLVGTGSDRASLYKRHALGEIWG